MPKTKFYGNVHIYLTLGLLIVLTGFSKTYFFSIGNFTLPYHIHGVSATLWMLLLIVQPYLYNKGLLKTHKILGRTSLLLVPLIIIGGVMMMRLMIQGQANYPPNAVYMLAFIDVCTLFGFLVLYILALYFRKNLMLHSRFMVSTIFGPLVPAMTRIFIIILGVASSFEQGINYSFLIIEFVLLVIIYKERKTNAVKYTYVPVLLFIIFQHILMYYINDWTWWHNIMNQFANYPS